MSFTVRIAPPENMGWICRRAGVRPEAGLGVLEAVDESGRILGQVGFNGWTPNSVCLHIALDSPAALRSLLAVGFDETFKRVGIAYAAVLSTNPRSLRLTRHLGFREVFRARDAWSPGVDVIWHEMRREECRYLRRERKVA